MPLSTTMLRADLSECVADLPITCVHASGSFSATSSEYGETREVELDGDVYTVDRTVVADVANVPVAMKPDDKLTVGGKPYRILTLEPHQDSVGVTIELKAVAR